MTDSPYVTANALFAVTDALLFRLATKTPDLEGLYSAAQTASFGPQEPSLTFELSAGPATELKSSTRPLAWFIRRNATTITERLDQARTASRLDGLGRAVDLSDLETDVRWPALNITVG